MITIEGQDFYNYAEALYYLFSLYEDVYTKEEIDEIISKLPKCITEEQIQTLINNALANYTTKEQFEEAVSTLIRTIDLVHEEVGQVSDELSGNISAIQGNISELRNAVNASAQLLIETMNDVDAVETDVALLKPRIEVAENRINKIEETKLYRHNVLLYYRHVNPELTQVGSDGNFQIAFTLINNDPESYSFKHNVNGTTTSIMPLDSAWQSLRLYRALPQNFRNVNANYMPSSGSALICEGTSAPLKVSSCIANYLLATYYNANGNWERVFRIHFSKVDGSSIAGAALQVTCGHPTFDANGNETSLWTTKEKFRVGEYNTYASYFCQNRIDCIDTVEEIINLENL